jgi:hypothetical protein
VEKHALRNLRENVKKGSFRIKKKTILKNNNEQIIG